MFVTEASLFGTEIQVEWDEDGDVAVYCGDLFVSPILTQEQLDEVYEVIGLFDDGP